MDYGYDQLVSVPANIRTKGLILSSNLTANLRHVGQQIMIEVPGIRSVFANMHINKKKKGINPQYFRAIGWPLNQTVSLVLDDKHKQWNFNIYTQQGEPVGFEGNMWEEFHDLYFNHLRGVNVIFIYTGQLYFKLRVFNSEGYCCDQDISASDSSEGEVDTIDYIRSNSDPNTFNVVMNTDVIQRGRLEIPWHIVRRLEIQDNNSLIIYYDEEPAIRMGRVYLSDYPNRLLKETLST
ncbi:OLC1v1032069C1 [Oldenlandia corymbosa var. corymbosa]|uniref:OLC1v1032069C1 n=1 Tax=Oldenlandia corymbosa var. corymbosa TaxID=529605 RepID=A0AAV1CMU3_OLDCO|nr:OLC1v1032069C1 [Oldenlandia corymbosa var. corymbosa]